MESLKFTLYRAARGLLPRGRFGDRVAALMDFLITHKRMPGDSRADFSSMLYAIRANGELLDPLRVFCTDKDLAKYFVSAVCGEGLCVETLAILSCEAQIDDYQFPLSCCIKPTHASGEYIIRKDGEPVNRNRIKRWLRMDYYLDSRETNYRHLRPKVIVEPLVFGSPDPPDYKIHCWNGAPGFIQVDCNRVSNHTRSLHDCSWHELSFCLQHPKPQRSIPRPAKLTEMLRIATKLSSYFSSYVRIDFFVTEDSLFVGEITNCHGGGLEVFSPPGGDKLAMQALLGEKINTGSY